MNKKELVGDVFNQQLLMQRPLETFHLLVEHRRSVDDSTSGAILDISPPPPPPPPTAAQDHLTTSCGMLQELMNKKELVGDVFNQLRLMRQRRQEQGSSGISAPSQQSQISNGLELSAENGNGKAGGAAAEGAAGRMTRQGIDSIMAELLMIMETLDSYIGGLQHPAAPLPFSCTLMTAPPPPLPWPLPHANSPSSRLADNHRFPAMTAFASASCQEVLLTMEIIGCYMP